MSWWLLAIAIFVLLRASRRRRWERRLSHVGGGQFPGWGGRSWGCARSGLPQNPAPLATPAPDPRRDLERTIAAVRDSYVAGRITVEEYEERLDELYRTAEGRRLSAS